MSIFPALVTSTQPTSLSAVNDQCVAIEAWAVHATSVPDLREATDRLSAIDRYLTRTSTQGRARVAAAMRRLEMRIGHLLGPAQRGRGTENTPGLELTATERYKFRRMARNEEIVEDEIIQSTDAQPAGRERVLRAIDAASKPQPTDVDEYKRVFRELGKIRKTVNSFKVSVAVKGSQGDRLQRDAVRRADRIIEVLQRFRDGVTEGMNQ